MLNKSVSVVIPCRNEEDFISKCLESFINQTYPKELLKIIVADGMSTDKTREIVNEIQKKNDNIILLDNEGLSAPKGMNMAIKDTDSEVIIIFGAHAYADKRFVEENIKALENEEVGCAGGLITTVNDSIKGSAIAESMSCPFGVGNALFRFAEKETYVDTVAFGAYRKEVLDEVGLFDEELVRNQDDELNFRVEKSGAKILLSPKIKSTYFSRGSYKKLWRQYFQYGFWKVRVIQKHKRPASIRHLVPLMFAIYLIGGGVLSLFSPWIRYAYFSIMALYIALDLVFSVKISMKKNIKYIPYLIPTFPILHLSYGLGFIMGLFNFYVFKDSKLEEKNKEMSR